MNGIGALVITHNEGRSIEGCLRSLSFCQERVVVDSFSDDDTVERARALADRIYQRSFHSYAEQKNWGLDRLRTAWVLVLDADERVPATLASEILRRAGRAEADGFWMYRRNHFFGRPIRGAGWGNDRVLRLFRRERGRYDDRAVHEEIRMAPGATVARCDGRLEHYSYVEWPSTFERILAYSTRGAADMAGRSYHGVWPRMILSPSLRFFKQYVLRGGMRDGIHGVVLCGLSAVGVFLRLAKLELGETRSRAVGAGDDGGHREELVHGHEPDAGEEGDVGTSRSPEEEES